MLKYNSERSTAVKLKIRRSDRWRERGPEDRAANNGIAILKFPKNNYTNHHVHSIQSN